MKTFAIIYDLRQPGRNYSALYDAIRTLSGDGNWQHPMESVWVVCVPPTITAEYIFKEIHGHMDNNDSLFVTEITKCDRQGWLPKSFWEWMKGK